MQQDLLNLHHGTKRDWDSGVVCQLLLKEMSRRIRKSLYKSIDSEYQCTLPISTSLVPPAYVGIPCTFIRKSPLQAKKQAARCKLEHEVLSIWTDFTNAIQEKYTNEISRTASQIGSTSGPFSLQDILPVSAFKTMLGLFMNMESEYGEQFMQLHS